MRNIILAIFITILLAAAFPFGISEYVISSTEDYIIASMEDESVLTQAEIKKLKSLESQCIMVLGAGLKSDGTPSPMLKDRLDAGIFLYKSGVAPKLLMSGDHGKKYYDEVNAMKKYALDAGVPQEDLFLDYAGFSTYESMYRAKAIFNIERMVVVTQDYHQYRSLYAARGFGIDAYGVSADQQMYSGQDSRDFREFLARNKDFIQMLTRPEPTFLGPTIPITGNGVTSHD